MADKVVCMTAPPISRHPVPKLEDLPDDIRARFLAAQERAGFVPNVFVTRAHHPAEFRTLLTCCNGRFSETVQFLGHIGQDVEAT